MNGEDIVPQVAEAFDRQAVIFDEYEEKNQILSWMRSVVQRHMLTLIHSGNRLLELNAGTGIDAVFFAQNGVRVNAIDISEGMLLRLKQKVEKENLGDLIFVERESFANLGAFPAGAFDCIFSNFGGLNCSPNPESVIRQFSRLLRPGGTVTLVVMPPVCPWEILFALKGNFRLGFRRFKVHGTISHIEGISFKSYYFTPHRLIKAFGKEFKVISTHGLASLVPPPYLELFPANHHRLFSILKILESKLSGTFPFNSWADHFILTMQYRP